MTTNGIFIKTNSPKSENEIFDDCKKLLHDSRLKARLIGASRHDDYEGMIARFDCGPTQIADLLQKKLLNDYDDTSIHALTTALVIEKAFPISEHLFVHHLNNQIQTMAPVRVLSISKIPASSKHPEVNSGRWITVLDVPEVDELPVFRMMGLPDRMVLMSPVDGEDLRVRFHCRLCDGDGHIQWRCLSGARPVEFLFESPRTDGSGPSCSRTSNGDNFMSGTSFEAVPHPLAMPEDIRNIVIEIGQHPLSVQELEAYINYVRNEPDPARFAARYYTSDIEGLREQMTKISGRFYRQTKLISLANLKYMSLLRNVKERLPGRQE